MTFSLGDLGTEFRNFSIQSNLLKTLSTNPYFAAFIITVILLLIVTFTFRHAVLPKNQGLGKLLLRTGIYAFGAILLIMYCHNYYMEEKFGKVSVFGEGPQLAGLIGADDIKFATTSQPTGPIAQSGIPPVNSSEQSSNPGVPPTVSTGLVTQDNKTIEALASAPSFI